MVATICASVLRPHQRSNAGITKRLLPVCEVGLTHYQASLDPYDKPPALASRSSSVIACSSRLSFARANSRGDGGEQRGEPFQARFVWVGDQLMLAWLEARAIAGDLRAGRQRLYQQFHTLVGVRGSAVSLLFTETPLAWVPQ